MRRWTCSVVFTTSPIDSAFCLLLLLFHSKIGAWSVPNECSGLVEECCKEEWNTNHTLEIYEIR